MNKYKLIFLVLSFLSFFGLVFSSGEILVVDYSYTDSNGFNIEDIYVMGGVADKDFEDGVYEMRSFDRNGVLLDKVKFNIDRVFVSADTSWFDENGNQIYFPEDEIVSYGVVKMPFYDNIKVISIYDGFGEEVKRVNLNDYLGESVQNINFDVKSDLKKSKFNPIGSILFLIVLLIIGFYFIRKKLN